MYPRSPRIIKTDNRRSDLHRLIHDLANLSRMRRGQRPSEHSEVLTEREHATAIYQAMSGDDPIARNFLFVHTEVGGIVLDEHVPFFEGAFVKQNVQALARR